MTFFIPLLGSVLGLFSQILAGDEETREHAIDFLKGHVINLIPTTFHPNSEAETALAEEIQKVCVAGCWVFPRNYSDQC